MPEHGCAAGIAPRNLLFPAWLPGTAENFTSAGTARQWTWSPRHGRLISSNKSATGLNCPLPSKGLMIIGFKW